MSKADLMYRPERLQYARSRRPVRTDACPPTAAYVQGGCDDSHVSHCPYCQWNLGLTFRDRHPSVLDLIKVLIASVGPDGSAWVKANVEPMRGYPAGRQAEPAGTVAGLLASLRDTDSTTRANAAAALGMLGHDAARHPEVLRALLSIVENDEVAAVRISAASALGKLQDTNSEPAFEGLNANAGAVDFHLEEDGCQRCARVLRFSRPIAAIAASGLDLRNSHGLHRAMTFIRRAADLVRIVEIPLWPVLQMGGGFAASSRRMEPITVEEAGLTVVVRDAGNGIHVVTETAIETAPLTQQELVLPEASQKLVTDGSSGLLTVEIPKLHSEEHEPLIVVACPSLESIEA